MDRRDFLKLGAGAGVGAAVVGSPLAALARRSGPPARSVATGKAFVPVSQFPAGVISGDPLADGVVLWTRIDPGVAGAGIAVDWELGTDPAFGGGSVIRSGSATTAAASDHTVHVEVTGLDAATTYWYRFTVAGTTSPVGRTRTLPDGPVDQLRIAVFSCQRYVHGYYNAHADLAARAGDPATDIDLVLSLGDYVYEAGPADGVTVAGRDNPDFPMDSVDAYRSQYHLYRTDLDLQAMHAAYPVVGIFDNHDGFSAPDDGEGPFARAAFFEQMPVRRNSGDPNRQYRSLRLGDLAEVFMLDERQYRDPTPRETGQLGTPSTEVTEMVEPGRTMLGSEQLGWLTDGMAASTASWKIIGSQLMFAPLRSKRDLPTQATAGDGPQRNAGSYVNMTQWDGYQAERRVLVDRLADDGVKGAMVVSGDSHFWTVAEFPRNFDDADSPIVLTEFAPSSITSANAGEEAGLPKTEVIRPILAKENPYTMRYIEVTTHGYGIVELVADKGTVTFVSPTSTKVPDASSKVLARFEVDRATNVISQVAGSDFMPRPDPVDTTTTTTTTTSPSTTSTAPGSDPAPAAGADPVAGQATFTG